MPTDTAYPITNMPYSLRMSERTRQELRDLERLLAEPGVRASALIARAVHELWLRTTRDTVAWSEESRTV